MGTPPLHKNGSEQAYKQELRALRETLEKDAEAHSLILAKLNVYETEIKVTNARSEEKDKAEITLRRQLLTVSLAFLGILVGLVAWAATEFRGLHYDVSANTAHFREFQAIGIEWGDSIDERAAGFREDIHTLEGLHRLRPTKKE
jgi:ferric-dicitrate binding protein FerR (iron transport regulator)